MWKRSQQPKQQVTAGRFEIERDGHVAFLDYNLGAGVLRLLHTEVPDQLQGQGIASELAKSALDWAREHSVKVDVICPFVDSYIKRHPEYADLILH